MIEAINEIEKELTDGLAYSEQDHQKIRDWLLSYATANELSVNKLRELCWQDSDWIFNQIF